MRQPNADQLVRINRFQEWAFEHLPVIWNIQVDNPDSRSSIYFGDETVEATFNEMLQALNTAWPDGDELHKTLVDYFIFPAFRAEPPKSVNPTLFKRIIERLLIKSLLNNPSDYAFEQLIDRVRYMLAHVNEGYEVSWDGSSHEPRGYLEPSLGTCGKYLSKYPEARDDCQFAEAFLQGEYCIEIRPVDDYDPSSTNYQFYRYDLYDTISQSVKWLHHSNKYSYPMFEAAERSFGHKAIYYSYLNAPDPNDDEYYADRPERLALDRTQREYHQRFAWKLLENPDNIEKFLDYFQSSTPCGLRWVLRGLELIELEQITVKSLRDRATPSKRLAYTLISSSGLEEGLTETVIVSELKRFAPGTLQAALPYGGATRNYILQALDWNSLITYQDRLFQTAGGRSDATEYHFADIPNCDSPEAGVIDRAAVKAILDQVDAKQLKTYQKLMKDADIGLKNTMLLFDAVRGTNRAAIEKSLIRHGQAAIKAYGLLPLESPQELRERYFALKRMHKEASQYGAERQANIRAAVQVALTNLAQTAGFSDATRMEWKLEAELAGEDSPIGRRIPVGDWEMELSMEGGLTTIKVFKQDKELKSVPPAVRKAQEYKDLKEVQALLKDQASRFKRALEGMLASGEQITSEDWDSLLKLPIVRHLVTDLILMTATGDFGLLTDDATALRTVEGKQIPLTFPVQLAHSYHLFQAEALSAWQREIVRQKIVQPFKQAFRELYILTPAEEETKTYSSRFAGHQVKADVASRLLQSRDWKLTSDEIADVSKHFPQAALQARIEFPDAGHYLAENPEVTIGEISFSRDNEDVPLTDIPPLIFSEVMRDVDLVAAVAHLDEENYLWSTESSLRQAELVTALVEDLGLKGVTVQGHFAYVQGKLARYRIHLGSGAIHIEPGNYLCIVPEKETEQKFYLPFAEADRKATEVLSKIFLLLNDHKITDESILAQIRRIGA